MAMELFQIFGRIGLNGIDDVNDDLDGVTGKAKGSSNKMVSAFKKIGAAVATYFAVDKIIDFGKACVAAAADVAAEEAAFEQIMGTYADNAQRKLNTIAKATGITNTRLTGYMTSLTAKFKGLGYDVVDATDLAARGLQLAADGAAFWDMSLDESTSHLNSFINGSYEGGEAIGLFANDTQMAMYAMEQGLIGATSEWAALDEATKQATRLEYAENMYALSGATGQAAKESDAYLNVQGNLTEAWRQFKATVGEPILNDIVLPVMRVLADEVLPALQENVSALIDWIKTAWENFKGWCEYLSDTFAPAFEAASTLFNNIKTIISGLIQPITDWISSGELATEMQSWLNTAIESFASWLTTAFEKINEFILWLQSGTEGTEGFRAAIVGVTTAIGTWLAAMAIQEVITGVIMIIKKVVAAFGAFNAVLLANPIALIVAAIAGLVAAFIYLWNNCEGFREFWINLWNNIKAIFNSVVTWLKTTLQNIGDFFTTTWDNVSTAVTDAWNNLKESATTIFNSLKDSVTNIFNSIKDTITNVWDNVKTTTTNVWNNVKTGVTNAVNGVKTTVTNVFNTVKTTVTNVWNNIKKAITDPMETAKETIKNVIDKIKGFLDFKWEFPKLKMPHFKVSGSANPLDWFTQGVPKLSVEWYKKGGVLTKPTLFGLDGATGSLMGGGEAGKEAVAPIDVLQDYVRDAVRSEVGIVGTYLERLMRTIDTYLPEVASKMDRNIVLDSGELVGVMDAQMGSLYRRRERGG